MDERPKSLFVSHGAPDLLVRNAPARDFLEGYGRALARPRAVLVASAHWESDEPLVGTAAEPETIHDFRGFGPELQAFRYPAPGAPEVAAEAAQCLADAGIAARTDAARGLDHGAWVPLALIYPDAGVPVFQLSVQPGAGPRHHLALGAALAPLAAEGVLVLASGSLTHNLDEYFANRYPIDEPPPDWVTRFGEWFHERAEAGAIDDLVDYRRLAPEAERNHPSEEHLLPFFVAAGAAGEGARARRIHNSHTYGVLQMDAYAFV